MLLETIRRAERGLIQADLGGGLIKERIARRGRGRSGGYRTVIAYRRGEMAVFLYGFAKSERANIDIDRLASLRVLGSAYLAVNDDQIATLIADGDFDEVPYG